MTKLTVKQELRNLKAILMNEIRARDRSIMNLRDDISSIKERYRSNSDINDIIKRYINGIIEYFFIGLISVSIIGLTLYGLYNLITGCG